MNMPLLRSLRSCWTGFYRYAAPTALGKPHPVQDATKPEDSHKVGIALLYHYSEPILFVSKLVK